MRYLLAASTLLLATSVSADPFEECPAKAFLTQGSYSSTYSVNLITGDYQVLSKSMQGNKTVNGLGFNSNDRFGYGWSYKDGLPARIHSDFAVEPLQVNNIAKSNFYVGDISTNDNKYYVYRPGAAYGLYSIGLDETAPDYLKMVKIIDGKSLNMSIADFAFHPTNDAAYTVDRKGNLHKIDVRNGTGEILAKTDATGTFGAAYFDADGNLYVSRNQDGSIFRIAIDAGDYTAQYFAKGPSSSTNDGFRCAQAPAIDVNDINLDFGDAPDSYGTSLATNGPRHGLSDNNTYYLGKYVDGESDASVYPLSDEQNGDQLDDDGVQFATSIEEATKAIAKVSASTDGYLSAWIDLNRDGEFNGNDQVLVDEQLFEGTQYVYMEIPAGVVAGESWARFRFTSTPGTQALGGAPDGEVEDYKVELVEAEATVTNYPTNDDWTTLSFEDNWPHEGDYDMNDLVVQMRTAVWSRPTGVTQVNLKGQLTAVGAAYHNGFAVRLEGVKRSQVDVENIEYLVNGLPVDFQPLEEGRDEAIFIVAYDVWNFVGAGELCTFYRTEEGCGSDIQMTFSARIPMLEPVDAKLKGVFDPFLFATPGAWHGGHFATAPGRAYEIHMKNRAPTEAFDATLFDEEGDDNSQPWRNLYYQTLKGLPWALEIGTDWQYPREYQDIGHAYPMFANWAQSGGWFDADWYLEKNANAPFLFTE